MAQTTFSLSVMFDGIIRTINIPDGAKADATVLMAAAQELSYTIFGKGPTDEWVCNRADELDKEMFN